MRQKDPVTSSKKIDPTDDVQKFSHINQITALAQSFDLLTTGMQQCHCLLNKLNCPHGPTDKSDPRFVIAHAVMSAPVPRASQAKHMQRPNPFPSQRVHGVWGQHYIYSHAKLTREHSGV